MARSGYENATLILEQLVKRLLRGLDDLARRLAKLEDESGAGRTPPQGDASGSTTLGVASAAIAARTGNTFPSGTVALTYPAPSTDLTTATNTSQARSARAYNWTGGLVPSGALVVLIRTFGVWVIIGQDCSAVAVPAPATPPAPAPDAP